MTTKRSGLSLPGEGRVASQLLQRPLNLLRKLPTSLFSSKKSTLMRSDKMSKSAVATGLARTGLRRSSKALKTRRRMSRLNLVSQGNRSKSPRLTRARTNGILASRLVSKSLGPTMRTTSTMRVHKLAVKLIASSSLKEGEVGTRVTTAVLLSTKVDLSILQ